ncbi:MAG: hypothetical protein ABFD69_04825 [Candidatus Sumerlaeia bacterium]
MIFAPRIVRARARLAGRSLGEGWNRHRIRASVLICLFAFSSLAFAAADQEAAALLRASLSNHPVPNTKASELADWNAYAWALTVQSADEREQALRDLYRHTDSYYLRGIILETVSENPDFRSRQAQFIRRYGYYANWFNRLMVTVGETLQGRIQAVAQLGVDAVNDLIQPAEADPLERRAYDMAMQSGSLGKRDPARFESLQRRVGRALAAGDLDRAQFAFDHDDPEAAEFYAQQALVNRPDWGAAEKLRVQAAEESAALRRRAMASAQVGYPDRTPPVRPADPELIRAILAGGAAKTANASAENRLGSELIASLPPAPDRGRAESMRAWQSALESNPEAPADMRRWAGAIVDDPGQNPDRRLDAARARRRGQLMHYIFIGSDTPRRRTYKAASWASQTYEAMQNIGVFFVFEVIGRSVQSAIAPPVPADEVRDAQAEWLGDVPDPKSEDARAVARALARADARDGRFGDARARLAAAGLLDDKARRKLDKAESRRLARMAESTPESSATLAARARAIDPDVKIKFKKQKPRPQQNKWLLDWSTLADWSGRPLPAGLAGSPEWFDGRPDNGEITNAGLTIERPDPGRPDRFNLRYPVRYPTQTRIFSADLTLDQFPERLRGWLLLSGAMGQETREKVARLKRLPIPMAVEGGAGVSGIDFHPTLLPIETRPGELELYR